MQIKKNQKYIVDIIDNGFEGEGIAKINSFTVFIPGALKGEKIEILIVKVLSSHGFGKILEIIEKSPNRVEPDCATFKRCGGCDLRHISYQETLKMKQNAVQSLVNKTLNSKIDVKKTVSMEKTLYYRNKLQFPVGKDKQENTTVGVFANRTHEIIPIKECFIQDKIATEISKYVVDIINKYQISVYDEKNNKGLIRHIVVKSAKSTNEYMVILVLNGDKLPHKTEIIKELTEKFECIKSIVLNINKKNTNVILGQKNNTIYGKDYITDKLGKFYFNISPLSFYQVNSVQAERMYNYAIKEAEITKEDVVFDLYCGIGTISIFMAQKAKKVYGVEIVEQAIEMANENAKLNNIENIIFTAGDTEYVLTDLIESKKIIPNVVIVDPPRKGLDNTTVNNIIKTNAKKVVYISCNPATLVRDLAKMEEKYEIKSITPFDLFPYSHHVECVAVLSLISR